MYYFRITMLSDLENFDQRLERLVGGLEIEPSKEYSDRFNAQLDTISSDIDLLLRSIQSSTPLKPIQKAIDHV